MNKAARDVYLWLLAVVTLVTPFASEKKLLFLLRLSEIVSLRSVLDIFPEKRYIYHKTIR